MPETTPTPRDQLSKKQREVLELYEQNKNPTEIGKALDITSQAVHGHFRRLRDHGYDIGATQPGRAAARARKAAPNGRFNPTDAIAAVREAAERGVAEAEARQAEIDTELAALKAERKELDKTIAELRTHLPATEGP